MATTDRLALPLLAAAQAQKEMTHNEALTLLDALVQLVVVGHIAAPPATPAPGQCWIVATGATGAWAGRDGSIACWTGGGWRFAAPFPGMKAWHATEGVEYRRDATTWQGGITRGSSLVHNGVQVVGAQAAAIAAPTGGGTIDVECRTAVASILATLRTHGLIST
jgi:Protein of unknown function (DUF2793)